MAERRGKEGSLTMGIKPVGVGSKVRGSANARKAPQRDRRKVRELKAPEAQPEGLSSEEASSLLIKAYLQKGGSLVEPAEIGSLEDLLQRESEETTSQFELRRRLTLALAKEAEAEGQKVSAAALVSEGYKMTNSARYGVRY